MKLVKGNGINEMKHLLYSYSRKNFELKNVNVHKTLKAKALLKH